MLGVPQSMTEAILLTLGRSRSSHFKKLGLWPKANVGSFVNFAFGPPSAALIVNWSASSMYNLLDFLTIH